jgi:capsular exopolysaccharide synthesis family protein
MRNDSPLAVIARRKWIIIATFLVVVVTTAVVSKTLQKVYSTDATLLVAQNSSSTAPTFDTVQASQAIARSYADIISSPNIAEQVAKRLGNGFTTDDVAAAMSFQPVPETQLLKVTAENPDPATAKSIADTYAAVFTDYARNNLATTTKATITLADAAPLPKTPARPKPTLYTMVAAVLALALGIGLAFLRERLDRRLRTQEDVEAAFDKPVLARVPRRGRSDASITAFKEAHRILRTNLQFAAGGTKIKSVAITSGREGEGKTTSAANLAIASAEVGLHVLVVEADFRRPALQRELMPNHPEPLRPGFSNYLVEAASLDEIIYPTGRPNISIVPSGPLPPTPSALLESRRGREAAAELAQEADLVIIDCPPLSIGADASVVAGWVDGVVIVLDLSTSTDQSVRSALRQLDAVHAPLLGLLLNRDRTATPSSYDYYSAIDSEAQQKARRGVSSR